MPSATSQVPRKVTIIGAGLAGLSLALSLYDHDIRCDIYELRSSSYNLGGAVMLSPNALRVLDHIGKPESVFKRVSSKGFHFDKLSFVNEQHVVKDIYYFGQKDLYGYHGFRIYRQLLIEEMLTMIEERGIPIHYERKFSHILSEDEHGVRFVMANGEELRSDILVGADGIHSTVRKHISDVTPNFGGLLAITGAIPTSALRMPTRDYPLPCTVQGKTGAFVVAPQNIDGSEVLIGNQRPFPALDHEGWAALGADKAKLYEMFTANKDSWGDFVQSAMEAAKPENLNMWPYHTIPKLESWKSESGRTIIIGDAAHAIPPSAGQGVNQAFEDAYALTLLLSKLDSKGMDFQRSLGFWQSWRQDRIDKVNDLTASMNNKRLPEAERQKVDNPTGGEGQLDWLYQPNLDNEMEAFVQMQAQ